MPRTRYSAQQKRQLIDLWRAGKSPREIGIAIGMGTKAVTTMA